MYSPEITNHSNIRIMTKQNDFNETETKHIFSLCTSLILSHRHQRRTLGDGSCFKNRDPLLLQPEENLASNYLPIREMEKKKIKEGVCFKRTWKT